MNSTVGQPLGKQFLRTLSPAGCLISEVNQELAKFVVVDFLVIVVEVTLIPLGVLHNAEEHAKRGGELRGRFPKAIGLVTLASLGDSPRCPMLHAICT
jgi:hypothetical protein